MTLGGGQVWGATTSSYGKAGHPGRRFALGWNLLSALEFWGRSWAAVGLVVIAAERWCRSNRWWFEAGGARCCFFFRWDFCLFPRLGTTPVKISSSRACAWLRGWLDGPYFWKQVETREYKGVPFWNPYKPFRISWRQRNTQKSWILISPPKICYFLNFTAACGFRSFELDFSFSIAFYWLRGLELASHRRATPPPPWRALTLRPAEIDEKKLRELFTFYGTVVRCKAKLRAGAVEVGVRRRCLGWFLGFIGCSFVFAGEMIQKRLGGKNFR